MDCENAGTKCKINEQKLSSTESVRGFSYTPVRKDTVFSRETSVGSLFYRDRMVKRFTETTLWNEDWFIAMPRDYQFFWIFLKDDCDHAGIWRPNLARFNKLYDFKVEYKKALKYFNVNKERINVLKNGRWFIIGFIPFQYGMTLNSNSRVHKSILSLLKNNEVKLTSIRPQVDLIDSLKDKDMDKDKDKDNNNTYKTVKKSNMKANITNIDNNKYKEQEVVWKD